MPGLSEVDQLAYSMDEPPDAADTAFAYSGMSVDPWPGATAALKEGQLLVVQFAEVYSLGGSRSELLDGRSARMTPQGRRRLRTRLSYFWSRPEASDVELLGENQEISS